MVNMKSFSYLSLAKTKDIKRYLMIFSDRNSRIKFPLTWKTIVMKLSLDIVKYRLAGTVL